ncbi:MAG TPA: hypothetical protein PK177_07220 [Burkholderiaceae bacterium]|nr:hypothetical protein [Burkholderiaceae bacterium]
MNIPTESVSRLLATLGASGAFATRFAVQADPRLHVEGVGSVSMPVTIQAAHRLCAAAQPAHHGYQDSEKADGMPGTLVVTLPSRFTGGEFVVSHQG